MKSGPGRYKREIVNEIGWRDDIRGPYVETGATELDSLRLYVWEISRIATLPYSQEQALFERMRQGSRSARERLILAYLRIVPKIAAPYAEFGLPILDLIQDGNLGLQKAVERFDHRRGFRLSSYAPYVIDGEIKRAIANTSRAIRIPVHAQQKLAKIKRVEDQLLGLLFREPTPEEVAEYTRYDLEEIEWLKSISRTPASLRKPLSYEEAQELLEGTLIDPEFSPEEQCVDTEMARELREAVGHLPLRERRIIEARWGLKEEEQTLEEIGQSLGLTRERVRQIESMAMSKLRSMLVDSVRPDISASERIDHEGEFLGRSTSEKRSLSC